MIIFNSSLSPQLVDELLIRLKQDATDLTDRAALELLSLQLQALGYDDTKPATEARVGGFLDYSLPDQQHEPNYSFLQPLSSETISDIHDTVDNPQNDVEIKAQKDYLMKSIRRFIKNLMIFLKNNYKLSRWLIKKQQLKYITSMITNSSKFKLKDQSKNKINLFYQLNLQI
ncbi:MAG: hypothetical protein EZS28_015477 [Streblomastix strix]|uniref:Uncharacterized protein n=1 Tax=Streblomastix strix TaxID=222440 RepID=A0A5J4W281_9EUKA|nr:MAG: hypothetical protein EZS28_015477 [Streblomastix strix]